MNCWCMSRAGSSIHLRSSASLLLLLPPLVCNAVPPFCRHTAAMQQPCSLADALAAAAQRPDTRAARADAGAARVRWLRAVPSLLPAAAPFEPALSTAAVLPLARACREGLGDSVRRMAKQISGALPVIGLISRLTSTEGGVGNDVQVGAPWWVLRVCLFAC